MTDKYQNLVDLQQKSCASFANREYFGTKGPNGYEWITYRQFGEFVDQFRSGLASLGVGPGDCVGVIANNRVEWAVGAYATYGLRGFYVPMYENQLLKDWSYIISDSGVKVLVVATDEIYEQVKDLPQEIENLQHIINLAGPESDPKSYKSLLKIGKEKPVEALQPKLDEPMGLIYTSGTTGKPKGVKLSHGNILSNVHMIDELLDIQPSDRSLAFLPWAHVFGQTCELHCLMSRGASSGFAENVTTIIENLAEVQPTLLFSVPRIFNKIYDAVHKKMADEGGIGKLLFDKGLERASLKRRQGSLGFIDSLILSVADMLVFSKIRQRFGGRLRYAFSGGSALNKDVGEFIDNLDITVYEGYGLSETSPVISANSMKGHKIGSVGLVAPRVKVVLDKSVVGEDSADGEIVVYGPNVMMGYHNLPEETAKVMTEDGGFRTGDLGRFDSEDFLFITGRIKEQYKLENGKYVVPSPMEEKLQLSPYINQVMIYGDNKLYNVALVVPDQLQLQKFADENGIAAQGEKLLEDSKVRDLIKKELETYGATFKGYERPKNFALVAEEWTPDNGLLTPTMKLKRRIVVKKFEDLLLGLYG